MLKHNLQHASEAAKGSAGGVPKHKDTKTVFGLLNQSGFDQSQFRTAKRQVRAYSEDGSYTNARRGKKPMPDALGRRSAVAHTAFGEGGKNAIDPHIAWHDMQEHHLA